MNNQHRQPDSLDALFSTARDTEAYLPDDLFSDRVISALPDTGGRGLSGWKKNGLIIGFATVGTVTAATLMPAISLPVNELITGITSLSIGVKALFAMAAGLFGLSALTLWASHRELI